MAELSPFQSTRLARGATELFYCVRQRAGFQSTRPARGATRRLVLRRAALWLFQSTRPARGATRSSSAAMSSGLFQSTRPARGATG